jgi:hypothetical protein
MVQSTTWPGGIHAYGLHQKEQLSLQKYLHLHPDDAVRALEKRLYSECYIGHLSPEWWKQLAEKVFELIENEAKPWRRALNDLTPGGSEFANDPEECKTFVKRSREAQHRVILSLIERRADAERRLLAETQRAKIAEAERDEAQRAKYGTPCRCVAWTQACGLAEERAEIAEAKITVMQEQINALQAKVDNLRP